MDYVTFAFQGIIYSIDITAMIAMIYYARQIKQTATLGCKGNTLFVCFLVCLSFVFVHILLNVIIQTSVLLALKNSRFDWLLADDSTLCEVSDYFHDFVMFVFSMALLYLFHYYSTISMTDNLLPRKSSTHYFKTS